DGAAQASTVFLLTVTSLNVASGTTALTTQPFTARQFSILSIGITQLSTQTTLNQQPTLQLSTSSSPLPAGEGQPALRSAFLTAEARLAKAVDEGGFKILSITIYQQSTPQLPQLSTNNLTPDTRHLTPTL